MTDTNEERLSSQAISDAELINVSGGTDDGSTYRCRACGYTSARSEFVTETGELRCPKCTFMPS